MSNNINHNHLHTNLPISRYCRTRTSQLRALRIPGQRMIRECVDGKPASDSDGTVVVFACYWCCVRMCLH
jgi:hypothetical protein